MAGRTFIDLVSPAASEGAESLDFSDQSCPASPSPSPSSQPPCSPSPTTPPATPPPPHPLSAAPAPTISAITPIWRCPAAVDEVQPLSSPTTPSPLVVRAPTTQPLSLITPEQESELVSSLTRVSLGGQAREQPWGLTGMAKHRPASKGHASGSGQVHSPMICSPVGHSKRADELLGWAYELMGSSAAPSVHATNAAADMENLIDACKDDSVIAVGDVHIDAGDVHIDMEEEVPATWAGDVHIKDIEALPVSANIVADEEVLVTVDVADEEMVLSVDVGHIDGEAEVLVTKEVTGMTDGFIVLRHADDWEERRYWRRRSDGRLAKVYACLLPTCVQEDGTPRQFTRLEYINLHRQKMHVDLNLAQIFSDRANAHKVHHSHKQPAKPQKESEICPEYAPVPVPDHARVEEGEEIRAEEDVETCHPISSPPQHVVRLYETRFRGVPQHDYADVSRKIQKK